MHEHGAIVLLAQLVQRLECGLSKHPARCREVVVTSGRAPIEELAAEIFAGIAEADGFDVVFFGGGVESDDLFAEVTRDLLQRSDHRNVQALEKDLRNWVKAWNENPKPFIWTKTADQILESLGRLLQRTNGAGH